MPMYVVRNKKKKLELERQEKSYKKISEKGSKVDRVVNNYLKPLGKYKVLKQNEFPVNSLSRKIRFERDGYSATGRQKVRGKSKPPNITI